jgi:hypothetical protein
MRYAALHPIRIDDKVVTDNVIHGRAANTTEVRIFPATTKIFNSTIFNAPFSLLLYINMPLSKEARMQMAITAWKQ